MHLFMNLETYITELKTIIYNICIRTGIGVSVTYTVQVNNEQSRQNLFIYVIDAMY